VNALMGTQWMFRWGKRTGPKFLPVFPRCWFRGAPLIAWIAGMAMHDLKKPDSRIRAFARHLLENRRVPQRIRKVVIGPAEVSHNGLHGSDLIEGKAIRVLEKRENEEDR